MIAAGAWIVGGHHDAHERMRSVLWFAAVAVWASAAVDVFTRGPDAIALHGKWLVVVTALLAAMLALPLWVLAPRSLQLLALVVSVNVGAAAAVYSQASFFGVGVPQLRWPAIVTIVVGLVTLVAGAFDVLRPKRTAMVLGSVAIIGGRCSSTSMCFDRRRRISRYGLRWPLRSVCCWWATSWRIGRSRGSGSSV